jgi:hypothetical protein
MMEIVSVGPFSKKITSSKYFPLRLEGIEPSQQAKQDRQ